MTKYGLKPLSECRKPIQKRAKSLRRSADDDDDNSRNESTAQRYINDIRWFDDWLSEMEIAAIDDLTSEHAHELGETLGNRFNGNTGINRWNQIYNLYQYFVRLDRIDSNPLDKWDEIKQEEFGLTKSTEQSKYIDKGTGYALSQSEVRMLENHPGKHPTRNKLLIRLLWQTGLRRGEAAELRLADLDMQNREVNVRAEIAKNGKRRVVPYQQSLDTLLYEWLKLERGIDPHSEDVGDKRLFIGERGGKLKGEGVNEVVVLAARRAGLNEKMYVDAKGGTRWKITAHSTRIGFGTYMANETDVSIYKLSKLLGHQSVEITESRYVEENVRVGVEDGRKFGPD